MKNENTKKWKKLLAGMDWEKVKYVITFEKEPEVGDTFTVGDKTFVAKDKEYKIVVV